MKINFIRRVLLVVVLINIEIHQIEIKTTFLNGDLEEEIYMEQHKGFSTLGQEKRACKWVKSLIGSKLAPKQ